MKTTLSLIALFVGSLFFGSTSCAPTPKDKTVPTVENTATNLPPETSSSTETSATSETAQSTQPATTPPDAIPPERRVWAYLDGQRKLMDIDEARMYGFTIVDLSDDWVPYMFWSQTPQANDYKENDYQADYVLLANDKIDSDGQNLKPSQHNYLEVYGIPPSLSVLRQRLVEEAKRPCFEKLDYTLFQTYEGPVSIVDPQGSQRLKSKYAAAKEALQKALRQTRAKSVEELLENTDHASVAKTYRRLHWQLEAIKQMQKRLHCEGMLSTRAAQAAAPGVVTWDVRNALKQFEKKHNVYGHGFIDRETAAALGRSAKENVYESFKRVLTERVISASGIVEDGSVNSTYTALDGTKQKVRNLVGEFSQALFRHLNISNADQAEAFLSEHTPEEFKSFFIAVPLPKTPEYYSDHMDFSVVIDRGDIWYDLPFDEKGERKPQPRSKYPSFTLLLTYNNQRFPLVKWRTTIGGWQPELRDGQEYYKYKISDVGPRIWRRIVAGPVWVPPEITPSSDLVKARTVNGIADRAVAADAFGPSFASAYGLGAAFHVTDSGFDNQIRTHGSANYLSINSSNGFSHGCHRLHNYRAVRLFSFVLGHRTVERKGQTRLEYNNRFEHRGEEFQLNLHTRGYYYELNPPIPVMVLEGNIKGELKQPIEEYVKKPSVMYQEDLQNAHRKPEEQQGSPRVNSKKTENPLSQPQSL